MQKRRLARIKPGQGGVELAPIWMVNDPYEVAKNDNLISINACLMVDLTGQVGSESIGYRIYSGTGGQADYVRGAAMSPGGKSFLCLNSTSRDKNGQARSNIILNMPPGQAVTIPRTDVMYVATEFGVVSLRNQSIPERAAALISIAHPDFREDLRLQAIEAGLMRKLSA
jgi:acyl-CoA hydrolase